MSKHIFAVLAGLILALSIVGSASAAPAAKAGALAKCNAAGTECRLLHTDGLWYTVTFKKVDATPGATQMAALKNGQYTMTAPSLTGYGTLTYTANKVTYVAKFVWKNRLEKGSKTA